MPHTLHVMYCESCFFSDGAFATGARTERIPVGIEPPAGDDIEPPAGESIEPPAGDDC